MMKYLRTISSIILVACAGGILSGLYAQPCIYVSPQPNAVYVSRYTNVILDYGSTVEPAVLTGLQSLQFKGSKSGNVQHSVSPTDKPGKVILSFYQPFTPGEIVRAQLPSCCCGDDAFHYTFRISRKTTYVDSAAVRMRSDTLPDGYPEMVINSTADAATETILMSPVVNSSVKLIAMDNSGSPQGYLEDEPIVRYLNFLPIDGDRWVYYRDPPGIEPAFYIIDPGYQVLDSFRAGPGHVADSHDFLLLESGHALILVYDRQPVDMSQVVAGGNPNAMVTGLLIQEVDNKRTVYWEWRSWDHFEITDGISQSADNLIDFTSSNISYVHGNSIELDVDGNLILSSRNLHEVTKIDRTTGAVIWRMGGKNNQFAFIGDSTGFTDQHDARMVGPERMTIFDNGNFHSQAQSRVVEYLIDEENLTATLIWHYDNPYGVRSVGSGNAQRLPNGNTLIGWGVISPETAPVATEVTPKNEIAYELSFSDGIEYYQQYSYRWLRLPQETSLMADVAVMQEVSIFPNPVCDRLFFRLERHEREVQSAAVFDFTGARIAGFEGKKTWSGGLDLAGLPTGTYLLRLSGRNWSFIEKFVVTGCE